ncbi:oxidoreductase [Rhizomicrobium electricum]|uniref:Oxidoreductase n=1 Tax=Rhizomicrobium electricum TaxID=480070 RepID=A0ABN1EAM3_9PROT|nr:oxidoreductase [Rhizomicrobium electricum]NIJ48088.1 putative dehydrogenase [Rhizomicrobium electricum]
MTLNVAVIGYGFGGRVFHAEPVARTDGMALKAIVSRRSEEIARDHPGVRAVDDPEAVFADPAIDLIAISTPNTSHFDLCARALEAGKHVVVDKPFTVTGDEARELKRRAEASGKLLTVFHNFRWYADYLVVKQLIAGGVLGEIAYFESHFDRWAPHVPDAWREKPGPGSGTWWDLAPHLLDQVLQLFGKPMAITCDQAIQRPGGGAADFFHATLRYEKLRVVLTSCFLAPEQELRFVVHGSKASFVKYGINTREGVDPRPGTLVYPDGSGQQAPAGTADGRGFYMAVRDAILGRAPQPVTLDDAILVMDVLEAGDLSAAERREVRL